MADTQNTKVQEQDIHQLLKVKREKLANLQEAGKDPFQITKYDVTHHSTDIKNNFEELEGKTVRIAGRVMSKRVMGKASFCNVQDLPGNIQVYVARDSIGEESYADFKKYDVGDIVGIEGEVFKTKTGEISVHASQVTLLSKSLQILPEKFHGLTNTDIRYRQRYTDLIMNQDVKDTFVKRSKIISAIRRYLDGQGFLEVETPMLVSNAASGKYGRAELTERYGDARPPEILVSDTLRAARRGERKAHFNKLLLDRIGETLDRGGQVMLFQNRRGFSPYVACSECGWTARCPHCNVTLTYHKGGRKLVCHYCGHTEDVPAKCPSCKVTDVLPMGFGTEKVEEEISRIFPEARVARLDRDSVTSEKAFSAIIADFEARRTDILVGTQMITKGFDFAGVSLVGILNADNLLNNPDFRAAERAFQLMMQVAGRAGRRDDGGEVVIQTSEPGHPVIRQVAAGDFEGMARAQLAERKAFFYPPYARLTSLTLRHRDPSVLRNGVMDLAARLRTRFGRRLLGPMTPPVDRIRGEYLVGLLLKIESGASSARARELLTAELKTFAGNPAFKSITVIVNVDPQ